MIKKEQTQSDHLHYAKSCQISWLPTAAIISWFLYFHPNSSVSITGKTNNEKEQKEVITYILPRAAIISWFLSFTRTVRSPSLRKGFDKAAANKMWSLTLYQEMPCYHRLIPLFSCKQFYVLNEKGFDKKAQTGSDHFILPDAHVATSFIA